MKTDELVCRKTVVVHNGIAKLVQDVLFEGEPWTVLFADGTWTFSTENFDWPEL